MALRRALNQIWHHRASHLYIEAQVSALGRSVLRIGFYAAESILELHASREICLPKGVLLRSHLIVGANVRPQVLVHSLDIIKSFYNRGADVEGKVGWIVESLGMPAIRLQCLGRFLSILRWKHRKRPQIVEGAARRGNCTWINVGFRFLVVRADSCQRERQEEGGIWKRRETHDGGCAGGEEGEQ